jgi:hypothetical protein
MATDTTSAIADDIRESIALSSVNSLSGQPANLSNLSYGNALGNVNLSQQNTVANQQAMDQVGLSVLGNAIDLISNLSPMEAVAVIKLDTGNDVAEQISDLKAALTDSENSVTPFPPTPPTPPFPPGPEIEANPSGGTTITLTDQDLPTEFIIER